MSEAGNRPGKIQRVVAVVVAGATFGLTGALAVASAQDDATPRSCGPSEDDLMRAAVAARQLEAQHPELFEEGPRADYDDLRLAAEWARRLSILQPIEGC